jgi:acyl-CoA thioesterase-1
MKRILFFGDSLTAGYGLANAASDSVPALIQKKIIEVGLHYESVNAGVNGDTTSSGLGRLDYWLSKPVDIFILELGINDLFRGTPLSATKHNLDLILKKVLKRHPSSKIVIMGMEVSPFISTAALDGFKNMYRELSVTYHTTYVPFYLEGVAGVKHLNLPDGLHPSAKGYEVIAGNIWPTIKSLIDELEGPAFSQQQVAN